jgi:3-oxoacyl-[acyl-carrier protein] reductase
MSQQRNAASQRLRGKVAIVTGASRGIGRSIALTYGSEGANVVVTGRTSSDLKSLEKEISQFDVRVLSVPGDASEEEHVKSVVKSTVREFGGVDILVNNAGILGSMKDFVDLTVEDWNQVINVNVMGYILFAREVLPHMLKKAAGNMINVSSGAGEKQDVQRRRNAKNIPYIVSKFAVEGLTNGLAGRLLGTGINVNAIKPGPVDSAFHAARSREDMEQLVKRGGPLQPPQIVNEISVYLASLAPGELTGESLRVPEWNSAHNINRR